jgi:hypothetical protein
LILAALFVIVIHASLYALWLRRHVWFGQERGILLYHVVSFTMLMFGLIAYMLFIEREWLIGAGALCLHGIYSLSFLELWALSEGGFSLAILRVVESQRTSPSDIEKTFTALADQKRNGRLQGLVGLRMAEADGEKFRATRMGQTAAFVLRVVRLLNNMERTG